jgi:hypothetical protein
MKTPYGADAIIELRKVGKKPADIILVSLIGFIKDEANPLVIVNNPDCDFRFLHDLDVMVVCTMETSRELINSVTDEIVKIIPSYCGIWFYDCADGINLCWGKFKPITKIFRNWTASERESYETYQ